MAVKQYSSLKTQFIIIKHNSKPEKKDHAINTETSAPYNTYFV